MNQLMVFNFMRKHALSCNVDHCRLAWEKRVLARWGGRVRMMPFDEPVLTENRIAGLSFLPILPYHSGSHHG
jgi:hypothetical protein